VYGLKPSHGRVSGRPTHTLGSVGVHGPIAASIDDLALAYRIMAQPDTLDQKSAMFPNPFVKADLSLEKPASKKYIGICQSWISRSKPAVLSLFEKALSYYRSSHHYEVVDITLPYLPQGQKAHALTILSEVRSSVTPTQIAKLTYANQLLLNVAGSHATCQDFLASQRLRELLMTHLASLWKKYPGMLVVTPTTPCAGWKVGDPGDVVKGGRGVSDGDMSLMSMEYVFVANWTGCPAISCPMGFAEGDVPVGIMVRNCEERRYIKNFLLTGHRLWASGEAKSSYWLGDARARACSKVKVSEDRNVRRDGSIYWAV
jgi:Asp-tRNA(Asn)/Glu-tRNA(Gln) amidotransferase A subunit family amidase